jgi:predicted alpha/beta-fold hydrolase
MIFRFKTEREIFELSDQGQIALDWFVHKDSKAKAENEEKAKPLLAIVPGVTGDASKMYMISIAKASY